MKPQYSKASRKTSGFDMAKIKTDIEKSLKQVSGAQKREDSKDWFLTGIPGFDELTRRGIPTGTANLVVGGPGSGKTIFCLQIAKNAVAKGKKVLYMSFEESEERLKKHMQDFGWDANTMEKKGLLLIKRFDLFEMAAQVEAMLEKARGELMIDLKPMLLSRNFSPDVVVIDSLSAVSSVFIAKEETYRVYIEQLFRLLEMEGVTSFLITESPEVERNLTQTGIEEFLADGVIVIYNVRHGNVRENGIEILKMRGAGFEKRMVAMEIKENQGIVVYPDQELFVE